MEPMPSYTDHQLLLMQLRRDFCGDNSAELARRIDKNESYVHRLFYPVGKKGAKGIGLEIMQACTKAFNLPPGFWESTPTPHKRVHTLKFEHEPAPALAVRESAESWTWPFKGVTPKQYFLLPEVERDDFEKIIANAVRNRGHPAKQA